LANGSPEDLRRLADDLDAVPRTGVASDDPEGSRTILVSDTMARQIAAALRAAAKSREVVPADPVTVRT
jgi:hypothetical protein